MLLLLLGGGAGDGVRECDADAPEFEPEDAEGMGPDLALGDKLALGGLQTKNKKYKNTCLVLVLSRYTVYRTLWNMYRTVFLLGTR